MLQHPRWEVDRIDFYRVSTAPIFVSFDLVNNFNALSMSYPPNVGDLILFPSALLHGVGPTSGAHTRINLAFNAFIRGEIGNDDRQNSLTL